MRIRLKTDLVQRTNLRSRIAKFINQSKVENKPYFILVNGEVKCVLMHEEVWIALRYKARQSINIPPEWLIPIRGISEAERNFFKMSEITAQHPVVISKYRRAEALLYSIDDYESLIDQIEQVQEVAAKL